MFVFGFESDNLDKIKQTIKFVKRSRISTVQFLILTPLPGTVTFRKLKESGRIKFSDWGLYDAHHAVFEPKKISIDELQHAQMIGHQSFYSLKKLIKRIFRFEWNALFIGIYARRLNRNWKKKNVIWLKVLDLLRPNFDFKINIDLKQLVSLPKLNTDQQNDQMPDEESLRNIGTQMSL